MSKPEKAPISALLSRGMVAATLICPIVQAGTYCTDNYVWFHIHDQNHNQIPVKKEWIKPLEWEHSDPDTHDQCDDPQPKEQNGNELGLYWDVARHKTDDMGTYYQNAIPSVDPTTPNPSFALGLSSDDEADQVQHVYYPNQLNFVIQFEITNLEIGGLTLNIPGLVTGQGSKTPSLKSYLGLIEDIGDTVFDAYDDNFEDAFKSLLSVGKDLFQLKWENNWYMAQKQVGNDRGAYMTTYEGEPAMVVSAFETTTNQRYPVVIREGGSDHAFRLYVLTQPGSVTPAALTGTYLGSSHILSETLGILRFGTDPQWIFSTLLGWISPWYEPGSFGEPDQFGGRWYWVDSTQSWLETNDYYPGYSYWYSSGQIYRFDKDAMRFEPTDIER